MTPSEIGLTVAGWLATTLLAYWWGLRSQRESTRHAARTNALTVIDKLTFDASQKLSLLHFFNKSYGEIRECVFRCASQASDAKRKRIHEAWKNYENLKFSPNAASGYWTPVDVRPDMKSFEKDQKAMLEALENLRKEIVSAD